MTFILNVLHKDFSLLAADKQAGASGTATFNVGGTAITINSPKITVNGFKKIYKNKNRQLAVGFAGNANAHGYIESLQESDGLTEALSSIHGFIGKTHVEADRKAVLKRQAVMENQAITTYFDTLVGEFFSNLFSFIPDFYGSRLYHSAAGGARLIHVGTGSSALEGAVGLDSIHRFLDRIRNATDPTECLEWIETAYQKVSEKAEGCSANFSAVAATRKDPFFSALATPQQA